MKLSSLLFISLILVSLLSLNFCSQAYSINEVQNWKITNLKDQNQFKTSHLINQQEQINTQALQLTKSEVVFVTYGYEDYSTDQNKRILQISIFNTNGVQIKSITMEDQEQILFVSLSLTNVEGEFILMYSSLDSLFIKAYNKDLEIQREINIGTNQSKEIKINPIISFGKNLLYAILYRTGNNFYHKEVIVLDFSDKSSISLKSTFLYDDYESPVQIHTNSIQAYSDDTAIAHFYGYNNSQQDVMVQVLFNSNGEEKSGYPKELQSPFTLKSFEYYWPWRSILHQDKETATFLASDSKNNLLIYTFSKNGDKICSELIDITGYERKNYYYGIFGEHVWFYLQDSKNKEGHFLLFDPEICSMDLSSIGPGTGLTDGMSGGFLDYDNGKIYIVEFGNLLDDSTQKIIQSNLYEIGSFGLEKKDENEDEDEDEDFSFILEFQAIFAIFIALIII